MNVLTLTTNPSAPFVRQQQRALARRGVTFRTLPVEGRVDATTSRGPGPYLRYVPRVLREARRGPYDLVHAHYGLTAPMALAQRELPVVVSLWGSDVTGPIGPLSRRCAPLCTEVIVMSERMAGMLECPSTVIPDGVDLELFSPRPRDSARSAVGWDDGRHHVLFPYSPHRIEKDYPRARAVIGRVDRRLERPVTLETVSGEPHERMPAFMSAADALLLTSRREGSPNAVKEAMACNLPVVATDVGDVRRRLRGVDRSRVRTTTRGLATALASILRSGERSTGRAAARAVSLDRSTSDTLAVYRRAVRSSEMTAGTQSSMGR